MTTLLKKKFTTFTEDTFGYKRSHEDRDYIRNIGMTDKSIMFSSIRSANPVIQCIAFDVFPSVDSIFDKFDFTINMGAFSFKEGNWYFHNDFFKNLSQRVLVINTKTDYPIISLLRAEKYKQRGYTLARKEMLKLGVAISTLDLTSWKAAKEHMSGMYGTNVDTLFSVEEDFSVDALVDILDKTSDVMVSSIATEKETGMIKGVPVKSVTLTPVEYLSAMQRLRKHTNRPYINTFYGVCEEKNFYWLTPDNEEQCLHIGAKIKPSSMKTRVLEIFMNIEEAKEKMEKYRYSTCLLALDIDKPENIQFPEDGIFVNGITIMNKEKDDVTITITDLIDNKVK